MAHDWDPEPKDRQWFRERSSGQLGWKVRRDGEDRMKLDRGSQDLHVPFDHSWREEVDHRQLNMAHVAQVAFAADKKLNRFLGNQDNAQKEWVSLSDEQRRGWIETGPKNEGMRQDLYKAIIGAMQRYSK